MLKAAAAGGLNEEDPVRVFVRERAQDHVVDNAEDSSGYAHAEGEREDDGEGKTRSAAQLAQRIMQVLKGVAQRIAKLHGYASTSSVSFLSSSSETTFPSNRCTSR